jgi:nanoRNase/pAp phosphatase (c-di-AMP/oligoRNAs hydrolase)
MILNQDDIKTLDDMLDSVDSETLIVMHDRPDPDCIGSALVARELLKKNGQSSTIVYANDTYHYQNQHMFNEFNLKDYVKNIDEIIKDPEISSLDDYFSNFKNVWFIDTQTPEIQVSFYKQLPEEGNFLFVDHHKKDDSDARDKSQFLVKESGACVSLLLDYMRQKEMDIDSEELFRLRGMAYLGIDTDTGGFQKMTDVDSDAKRFLIKALTTNKGEKDIINKIKTIEVPDDVIVQGYANVLQNIQRADNGILYCALPEVISRDTARIAFYADKLMNEPWEQTSRPNVVIVYGLVLTGDNGTSKAQVMASGRSSENNNKIDLIDMFKNIFYVEENEKRINYSGGRKLSNGTSTAGAVIPMERYDKYTDDLESLSKRWQADDSIFFKKRLTEYLGKE